MLYSSLYKYILYIWRYKMRQTYAVRINRKDLYKQNYSDKEYKGECKEIKQVVNKNLIDLFIKILEEGA